MAIKQYITLSWKNTRPSFLLYDHGDSCFKNIPLINYINLNKGAKRICKGYYDLIKRSFMPCPDFQILMNGTYTQCKKCENLSGFSRCLGCNGSMCNTYSDAARQFCNQEHYIYLAYFEKDVVKVGTAAAYRRYERLLEQGALYSLFIATTPNGRIARQIEHEIGHRGIVLRVSATRKANNVIITSDAASIHEVLIHVYRNLLIMLEDDLLQYFITPEPLSNNYLYFSDRIREYFVAHNYQRTLFDADLSAERTYKNIEVLINPKVIQGEVLSVIGNLLIVRDNDSVSVISTKTLSGWEVTI